MIGRHFCRPAFLAAFHRDRFRDRFTGTGFLLKTASTDDGDDWRGVAVDDEEVGEFARLEGAEFVVGSHDLSAGFGGAGDDFQGGESNILDEEDQFAGVIAVRVPAEAVVAAHAEAAAGTEDATG